MFQVPLSVGVLKPTRPWLARTSLAAFGRLLGGPHSQRDHFVLSWCLLAGSVGVRGLGQSPRIAPTGRGAAVRSLTPHGCLLSCRLDLVKRPPGIPALEVNAWQEAPAAGDGIGQDFSSWSKSCVSSGGAAATQRG